MSSGGNQQGGDPAKIAGFGKAKERDRLLEWGLLVVVVLAFWEPFFNPQWQARLAGFEIVLLGLAVLSLMGGGGRPMEPVGRLAIGFGLVASFSAFLHLLAIYPLGHPVFWTELGSRLQGELSFDQRHPLFSVRALWTLWSAILMFLLVARATRRRPAFGSRLIGLVMGNGVLAAILGVAQGALGVQPAEYWMLADPHLLRVGSTLSDPNALGALLVLFVPLLIGRSRDWGGWAGALPALGAVLVGVAIVLTASRAAILGMVAMGVGAVLWRVRSWLTKRESRFQYRSGARTPLDRRDARAPRRKRRWAVGVLLVGLVVWGGARLIFEETGTGKKSAVMVWVRKSFQAGASLEERLRGRLQIWKHGVEMVADFPVFGAGPGTTYARMPHYRGEARHGVQENLHNSFLQDLAEVGLVGLALELWLFGWCCQLAWRSDGLRRGQVFGLLGFWLACQFGHPMILAPIRVLLWGLLGWMAVGEPGEWRGAVPGRRWCWGPVVLVVALSGIAGVRVSESLRAQEESCIEMGFLSGRPLASVSQQLGSQSINQTSVLGWIGSRAWVRLPVFASCLQLPLVAPARKEAPTRVRVRLGGELYRELELPAGQRRELSLCLDSYALDSTIELELGASPLSEPGPGEARRLGVWLGEPAWSCGVEDCQCRGFHSESSSSPWMWTRQQVQFRVRVPEGSEGLELPILVAHPDTETAPVRLTLRAEGRRVLEARIDKPGWQELWLPLSPGEHQVSLWVSRTWSPRRAGTGEDPRELGVGLYRRSLVDGGEETGLSFGALTFDPL